MRLARLAEALGAGGAIVGCGSMAAMLPGLAASVLGSLGLGGSSVISHNLAPIARPWFIASVCLFTVAALFCGWAATALAASGSMLLYLSMFVLSSHATSMPGMPGGHAHHVATPLFWTGLAAMLASLVVTAWRRRRRVCRPLMRSIPAPHVHR